MSERNPPGKVVAYWYIDKTLKKAIELEALKQDVTGSEYAELLLKRQMKDPPLAEERRGRKKKATAS